MGENDFDYIVWVTGKLSKLDITGEKRIRPSLTCLEDLLDTILIVLGFENDVILSCKEKEDIVLSFLDDYKCFIVLDNMETINMLEYEKILSFCENVPNRNKILLTSRHTEERPLMVKTYRITGLEYDDAIEFIKDAAGDSLEISNASEEDINLLIEKTGGVPLALKFIIAQISDGIPIKKALKDLSVVRKEELQEFCFKNSYNLLDEFQKKIIISLSLFDKSTSANEISVIVDGDNLLEITKSLSKMYKLSLINRSKSDDALVVYELQPLVKDFVHFQSDLDQSVATKLKSQKADGIA